MTDPSKTITEDSQRQPDLSALFAKLIAAKFAPRAFNPVPVKAFVWTRHYIPPNKLPCSTFAQVYGPESVCGSYIHIHASTAIRN